MRKSLRIISLLLASFIGVSAFMEADPITEITEKFNAFNRIFPQTKLHLSFNQPAYAAGDTAFFKAYLLSDNLIPIRGRQIMNLAIIDGAGQVRLRQTYRIDEGTTASQTLIPKDLEPGIYRLVAYTNWMKNFSSKLFFNTLLTVAGESQFEYAPEAPVKIELFPEGGNLVAQVATKVIAVATRNGKPAAAEGSIVDENGAEITRFACDKNGLATFELKPERQVRYKLVSREGGSTPLTVEQEGYALSLSNDGELIKATIGLQSRKESNESVTVILTSRSQIKYASMIGVSSTSPASVLIPVRGLPAGIAQLTVFDEKTRVVANRLVYIAPPIDVKVDLRLDKQVASTRSPVSFEFDIKDQFGASKSSDMLVTSYYKNLFPNVEDVDFEEELLVASDIPGSRSLLAQIDISTPDGAELLDQYLITRQWERFSWDEVLSNKKKEPEFLSGGTLIYDGIATFTDSGKPVPDSTLVLLFLQERTFGYEVYTSANGALRWPVYFDFYGSENIMYSMESRGKRLQNTNIRLLKDSLSEFSAPITLSSKQRDPYYSFSNVSKVVNSSFSYGWNKAEIIKSTANPNAPMEDELNGVDATINVEEYVVFPTMEDLFREVVRFVQNKKVGGKPTLRVLSTDSNSPITGDPLCIVDGIATRNIDFIFSLKPGDIAVIKVVNDAKKLRNLGSITKNGVIFFQTKIADIGKLIPKDDILYVDGLVKPVPFNLKNPATIPSHTPVLRSTVYWKTQLERNERGLVADTFYSADNTGVLEVRVQGITSDGIPFDQTQKVEVDFQKSN